MVQGFSINKFVILCIFMVLVTLISATAINEYVHLKADNTTTNTGDDDSTYTGNSLTYGVGIVGSAFVFDSATDNVVSTNFNWDTEGFDENSNWTFNYWLNPQSSSNGAVSWANGGTGGTALSVETNGGNHDLFFNAGYRLDIVPSWTGTWQMITLVHDANAGLFIAYVNGTQTGNVSDTGYTATTSNSQFIYLGSSRLPHAGLSETMDDVRFYNQTLTTSHLATLYNSSLGTQGSLSVGAGNSAPVVVNNLPLNTDHDNVAQQNYSFNYSDADSDAGNCDLIINGTKYGKNASVPSGSNNVVIQSNVSLSDGGYSWYVNCSDGTDASASSSYTYIIDTIAPVITWTTPNNANSTTIAYNQSILTSILLEDLYLFEYNISVFNNSRTLVYSNETTGLTSASYTINDNISFAGLNFGTYTFNVSVSDDHTAKEIPEYQIVKKTNGLEYNISDTNISVFTEEKDLVNASTIKLVDRYSFAFEYSKVKKIREYVVTSNKKLFYRGDLYPYPVFVTGSNWVDFNSNNSLSYNVTKVSDFEYRVVIEFDKDNLKDEFQSIGGLNIRSEERTIELQSYVPVVVNTSLIGYSGSGTGVVGFNLTAIDTIERFNITLNITDVDSSVENVSFWFRNSNGSVNDQCPNAISSSIGTIGNRNHTACFEWLESRVVSGSLVDTPTLEASRFLGDGVTQTNGQDGSNYFYEFMIDEYYKPVYKDYPFNGSAVTFSENLTGGKIQKDTARRLKVFNDVPLDANVYTIDARVLISSVTPTASLNLYICNKSYVSGDWRTNNACAFVGGKTQSELQDTNKFRYTLSNNFFPENFPSETSMGNFSIILEARGINPVNRYYSVQTAPAIGSHIHTSYTIDSGVTWVNETAYKDLTNINWLYDDTCFEWKFQIESVGTARFNTSTYQSCYSAQESVGNLRPNNPIFFTPSSNETIFGTYNISGTEGSDPNNDTMQFNLSLYNSSWGLVDNFANEIPSGTTSALFDTTAYSDGSYYIVVFQYENETAEQFVVNTSVSVSIENNASLLQNFSLSAVSINDQQSSTLSVDVNSSNVINNVTFFVTNPDGSQVQYNATSLNNQSFTYVFDSSDFYANVYGFYTINNVTSYNEYGKLSTLSINQSVEVKVVPPSQSSGGSGLSSASVTSASASEDNVSSVAIVENVYVQKAKDYLSIVYVVEDLGFSVPYFIVSDGVNSNIYVVRIIVVALAISSLYAIRLRFKRKNQIRKLALTKLLSK